MIVYVVQQWTGDYSDKLNRLLGVRLSLGEARELAEEEQIAFQAQLAAQYAARREKWPRTALTEEALLLPLLWKATPEGEALTGPCAVADGGYERREYGQRSGAVEYDITALDLPGFVTVVVPVGVTSEGQPNPAVVG